MTAAGDVQAVLFGLGVETFAVPVEAVREILDHRAAFAMPNAPDWLLGLTDVRGESVPMVDLRVRLGLPAAAATGATRVLVVDVPLAPVPLTLGLVVDRVLEVSSFAAAAMEAAPEIGTRWRSAYIDRVVRRDGGFVVLLALARLFDAADRAAALSGLDAAA